MLSADEEARYLEAANAIGEDILETYRRARRRPRNHATGERAVAGMSGNKAALIIAAALAEELTDEAGSNVIKELQEQLRAQLNQGSQAE